MQRAIFFPLFLCFFIFSSCGQNNSTKKNTIRNKTQKVSVITPEGKTVKERFNPPEGYERISVGENSFGAYLRNLRLKPFGSPVHYYHGKEKANHGIYVSVVDMDIDKQDLQQCADAVMRLRGEYLFGQKRYEKIHFNFVSDCKPRYFTDYVKGDFSYKKFRAYMRQIFSYANTSSLHDELKPVPKIDSIQSGDVFIQKKNPFGHAVIVVDVAINKKTGKKVYMLAQSYMPAQETQILENPNEKSISPWYEVNNSAINTPEWIFEPRDLRRFKD